jgi:tetratricopeptide (TPR) repeat protein
MPRWHVACDNCGAEAWIGGRAEGMDAWCEACQHASRLAHDGKDSDAACPHCGVAPLSTHGLRFEELYGSLQDIVVVLGAWNGDAAPLEALLPDRPRFLTDLNPPAVHPRDDAATVDALEHLRRGDFAGARERLEALLPNAGGSARLWRALGIAAERLEEPALAEAAYGRALEHKESPRVRLARGALRGRRGDFAAALTDLERAGDDYEARWNRAALTVLEAVAHTTGLPPEEALGRARAEIPAPSSYWAEPTVGRLLWSLLIERLQSRAARELSTCPDERALRAAENELEFDTFWDRALVVNAYAAAGMRADLERTASALALDLLTSLASEPALAGPAAREIAEGVRHITGHVRARKPAEALAAARALLGRDDLPRYRIPCARCSVGSVGVDQVLDEAPRRVARTRRTSGPGHGAEAPDPSSPRSHPTS